MRDESGITPADQESLVLERERRALLFAAIAELAGRHQLLLELRYDEDCTFLDIAMQFEVSEPAVHQMHGRILRALRQKLNERKIRGMRDVT